MKLIRICLHVWESTDFHMGACGKSSASCWKNKVIWARFDSARELNWFFWLWNVILQNIFRWKVSSYQRSTVIKIYWLAMKICNMYVWVILSKPGSNNLYLKVPPFNRNRSAMYKCFRVPWKRCCYYILSTGYYTLHYTVLVCILLFNPPTTPNFMPMHRQGRNHRGDRCDRGT